MYIHKFQIQNFKSFKDVTLFFNKELNVLTGVNNSGKTTVLEALSLWQECFEKLITEAEKTKIKEDKYRRGDFTLESSSDKYFSFKEINSVRIPNYEDIFYQRNKENSVFLSATLLDEEDIELCIIFKISNFGGNYIIKLENNTTYNYRDFNDYFRYLPSPISIIYGTPLAQINSEEDFATTPKIKEQLLLKRSDSVLRSRLYRLLNGFDALLASNFREDLNFILYNSEKQINFEIQYNIQKDTKITITFKVGNDDVFKDLSLLGSGTLQIIEILLNLYSSTEEKKDLDLVLLDEPDSHIHRDLQKRLIGVFNKYGQNLQLFITTHNESLIRSVTPKQVFHLEGKPTGEIKSIHFDTSTPHLGLHFKGIMPSNLTPVMRSIGNTTGLDFINALEADKLIFVEGEDDAKVFRILLNQQINNRKKYMFWVLGGISEIFENILAYKYIFSSIKNGNSLWDKSVLTFDKDELSGEHKELFIQNFQEKLNIKAYSTSAYTFESTLFTDFEKTAKLLSKLIEKANDNKIDYESIEEKLIKNYFAYEDSLNAKFNEEYKKNLYYRYKNSKVEKANKIFDTKKNFNSINLVEYDLVKYVNSYIKETLDKKEFYKLMDKNDIENIIKQSVDTEDFNFSIETDFIELIKLVNKSTWISEWDFLNKI